MVRLEEFENLRQKAIALSFQFQYGAIRSPPALTLHSDLYVFQFQYGAIRRKTNSKSII